MRNAGKINRGIFRTKQKMVILLCVAVIALSGCAPKTLEQGGAGQPDETEFTPQTVRSIHVGESVETNPEPAKEPTTETTVDGTVYIGEYLDSDVKEPNLEIAKGEDGRYIVQIGIYRLTSLDDGRGELTAEGMAFTATDAAGNPISGVITLEGETATVTFTDSTWEDLKNGSSFQYTKSSDIPNIWGE